METLESEKKVAAGSTKLWNREYNKVMICNFLLFFAFYLLTPLLPLYLDQQFDADKDMIGLVLSGYVVATLLIRPFSGFMVDSFDRKTVLTIFFSLSSSVSRDMWEPAHCLCSPLYERCTAFRSEPQRWSTAPWPSTCFRHRAATRGSGTTA